MKTPTPQEQAEMLIEKHHECFGIDAKDPDLREAIRRTELDAAIVTVETVIKAQPLKNGTKKDGLKYWQEVLTILKGKL